MDLYIPKKFLNKSKKSPVLSKEEMIEFEEKVKDIYETGVIKGPVHLSKNNEDQLIEIFSFIDKEDWVFSNWRNHYHALLHGVSQEFLLDLIVRGKSMSVYCENPKFYTSSIVGGTIPIALGAAWALKNKGSSNRVWLFCGDMTAETGIWHETYKYARAHNLPIEFVIEDNNMSTNTPTDETWNGYKSEHPEDVFYYQYQRGYPHHGTGSWILF